VGEVVWAESALHWLREIHGYIARDNPEAAMGVVRGIVERTAQLAEFPESGQLLALRGFRNLRVLLFGHYRIAYRLRRRDLVEVVGVYHGALDIARRLRADLKA